MRVVSVGHAVFAATLIAIGIMGLAQGDFGPIWQPVGKGMPARELLAYLCALISLVCGIGLLWPRSAVRAAGVLLGYLLLWLVLIKGQVIYRAPTRADSWESGGETAVIIAGAGALYAGLAAGRGKRALSFATGAAGICLARVVFGLALIPLGLAHLAYVSETAALVPAWLPAHAAWVYVTGGAYIVAGAAVLCRVCARLATGLAALQMGLFTLLVWLPMLLAGAKDPFIWSETVISWALTAAAWAVADSYRGTRWLAVGQR